MAAFKIVFIAVACVAGVVAVVWPIAGFVLVARRVEHRCPSCLRARIRPSWPRPVDRLVPWARPFRCSVCLRRFYLPRSIAGATAPELTAKHTERLRTGAV